MYAWVAAKAKTNRRVLAEDGHVCATAAQAVQALGHERGGLRAPLCRRHTRRVVKVGRRQGCPAGMSNQRAVSQYCRFVVSQRSVILSL